VLFFFQLKFDIFRFIKCNIFSFMYTWFIITR
jgi:hypothetical protein